MTLYRRIVIIIISREQRTKLNQQIVLLLQSMGGCIRTNYTNDILHDTRYASKEFVNDRVLNYRFNYVRIEILSKCQGLHDLDCGRVGI